MCQFRPGFFFGEFGPWQKKNQAPSKVTWFLILGLEAGKTTS